LLNMTIQGSRLGLYYNKLSLFCVVKHSLAKHLTRVDNCAVYEDEEFI